MKIFLAALAISGVFSVGATIATAQQSEVFVLGAMDDDDDTFAMGSYRYTFGNGGRTDLGLVISASARTTKYFNGTKDVSIDSQRLKAGYRFETMKSGVTTVMLGYENVDGSNDDQGGVFSFEHWNGLANGDNVFVLAEYAEARDVFYASANYAFSFQNFSAGPVVTYVSMSDYTATDIGVQGSIRLGNNATLMPTVTYREADIVTNPSKTSVVGSLGLHFNF